MDLSDRLLGRVSELGKSFNIPAVVQLLNKAGFKLVRQDQEGAKLISYWNDPDGQPTARIVSDGAGHNFIKIKFPGSNIEQEFDDRDALAQELQKHM